MAHCSVMRWCRAHYGVRSLNVALLPQGATSAHDNSWYRQLMHGPTEPSFHLTHTHMHALPSDSFEWPSLDAPPLPVQQKVSGWPRSQQGPQRSTVGPTAAPLQAPLLPRHPPGLLRPPLHRTQAPCTGPKQQYNHKLCRCSQSSDLTTGFVFTESICLHSVHTQMYGQ